jgi:hypothetical protein
MTDDVYRRALAAMPTPQQVWAQADTHGDDPAAEFRRMAFAAYTFDGLYAQTRGLLEALLAATEPRVAHING